MPREVIKPATPDYPDVKVGWQSGADVQIGVIEEATPDSGMWSHLDRAGCNALIKAVRRARDSAFGRDE